LEDHVADDVAEKVEDDLAYDDDAGGWWWTVKDDDAGGWWWTVKDDDFWSLNFARRGPREHDRWTLYRLLFLLQSRNVRRGTCHLTNLSFLYSNN
jgi:hypothetical protein